MYGRVRNQRYNTDELQPYRLCIPGLDKEKSLSSFVQHPGMEISMEPSAALQSLPTLLLLSDRLLPACQELRRGAVKTFSPLLNNCKTTRTHPG